MLIVREPGNASQRQYASIVRSLVVCPVAKFNRLMSPEYRMERPRTSVSLIPAALSASFRVPDPSKLAAQPVDKSIQNP